MNHIDWTEFYPRLAAEASRRFRWLTVATNGRHDWDDLAQETALLLKQKPVTLDPDTTLRALAPLVMLRIARNWIRGVERSDVRDRRWAKEWLESTNSHKLTKAEQREIIHLAARGDEIRERIVKAIFDEQPQSTAELARFVQISESTVRRHLAKLIHDVEMLMKDPTGGHDE